MKVSCTTNYVYFRAIFFFFLCILKAESFVAITPQLVSSGIRNMKFSNLLSLQDAPLSNNPEFLDQVLQVAIEASKKAGDLILGNAGGAKVTERKANSRDLLTLIDPLCEKVRVPQRVHESPFWTVST
jgi:hypothetical protein